LLPKVLISYDIKEGWTLKRGENSYGPVPKIPDHFDKKEFQEMLRKLEIPKEQETEMAQFLLKARLTSNKETQKEIPSVIDPETYFEEKKFIPNKLGTFILKNNDVKTIKKVMYRYNPETGIYEEADEYLTGLISKILQNEETKARVNEVLFNIETKTYQELLTPPITLIPVLNGILDITDIDNITVIPYSKDYFFTSKVNVHYDPEKKCPNFIKFINEVIKKGDIDTIQEYMGYCFYRSYKYHKALLLVGEGGNGKSTLLNVLRTALGNDNVSSISLQDLTYRRFAPAYLYGKYANIYPDVPKNPIRSTGTFKLLTGNDQISADRKNRDYINFVNIAKLVFSCNIVPSTEDDTLAWYRRWIIATCDTTFENQDNEDKNIFDKISTPTELSGFLNWCLQGLKRLLEKNQFTNTKSVVEIRENYLKFSNPVQAFIVTHLESDDPNEYILKDKVYQAYIDFCTESGLPTTAKNIFNQKIPQYIRAEGKRIRIDGTQKGVWYGIKILDEPKGFEDAQQTLI